MDRDRLTFSQYFEADRIPISVRVMEAWGVTGSSAQHSHEFSELAVVTSGEITHRAAEASARLKTGDVLLLHPGMMHTYMDPSPDGCVYNLIYDASAPIPGLLLLSGRLPFTGCIYPPSLNSFADSVEPICRIPPKTLETVRAAMDMIAAEKKNCRPGSQVLISNLFSEIIVLIGREYTTDDAPPTHWYLNKVTNYLQHHFAEKITVSELAKIAGMSERTLTRQFNSAFGIGPAEYRMALRVTYAAKLLKNRSLTLAAVAEQSGFSGAGHLWKALKKKLNLTPAQIRKKEPG
ncbi:MAG: HTH-type transcriptional activator RhaR [Lentisphaerae bacterium ADurb.Bin242]|nr:MAG: HTH-type transcriptional activator RhaR [Lentisphaerae bacterium ADurb.Bin242]